MMLSIIVNHYKSPEVLKLCLNYLKKNAPQGSEIIVTDSETLEKTQDMMRYDFPEIIFLQEKGNIGFAKSVNRGIGNAQGDFFLIINADVMITEKNAIPQMLAYMKKHKDIGILGPRLFNINGEHQSSCFRFYTPRTIIARRTPFGKTPWGKRELDRFLINHRGLTPMAFGSDPGPLEPAPVDWLMGSTLLVRKAAYEDVGPMNEEYFMYMEDVDWCRSFWKKEWKVVYYPETFFYHYHFRASKGSNPVVDLFTNKYARIHLLSAIKYFRKYGLKVPKYGI